MMAYDWPGNVRELENCLERSCALTTGPVIQLADLPGAINGSNGRVPVAGDGRRRSCRYRNWSGKPS